MLAPPALAFLILRHLIGAKFVGPADQSLMVLHDKTSQKKETSLHSQKLPAKMTGNFGGRTHRPSSCVLNIQHFRLTNAVIRATRPDAYRCAWAQIIGVLEWENTYAISDRFHLRASTLAPVLLFSCHAREFSRASHGSGESCAGGGICPLRAREQPQNHWWISQLQEPDRNSVF